MNNAFNERVLFKIVDPGTDSKIYGIETKDLMTVEILDWGTLRDGTPFEAQGYKPGTIAYLRKDSKGIKVGEDKWLIDRGHILGFD